MPQMMPINWFFSLFFFISLFFLFNIMNYFIFNHNYPFKPQKLNSNNNNNFSWKW